MKAAKVHNQNHKHNHSCRDEGRRKHKHHIETEEHLKSFYLLGIPDTSFSGRSTRMARRVLKSILVLLGTSVTTLKQENRMQNRHSFAVCFLVHKNTDTLMTIMDFADESIHGRSALPCKGRT